jgi:hypothetical protein
MGPSGYPRTAVQCQNNPIQIPDIALTNRFGFRIFAKVSKDIVKLEPLVVTVVFQFVLNTGVFCNAQRGFGVWCIYGKGTHIFTSKKFGSGCKGFWRPNDTSWVDITVYFDLPSRMITVTGIRQGRKCTVNAYSPSDSSMPAFYYVINNIPARFDIGMSKNMAMHNFIGNLCCFLVFADVQPSKHKQKNKGEYRHGTAVKVAPHFASIHSNKCVFKWRQACRRPGSRGARHGFIWGIYTTHT